MQPEMERPPWMGPSGARHRQSPLTSEIHARVEVYVLAWFCFLMLEQQAELAKLTCYQDAMDRNVFDAVLMKQVVVAATTPSHRSRSKAKSKVGSITPRRNVLSKSW